MRLSVPFMTRQRLKSAVENEGVQEHDAVCLALDLYLLAPASLRAQVAAMQDLPPHQRRRAYSEIHDALDRGVVVAQEMERGRGC